MAIPLVVATGVTVAVLSTGVDPSIPGLKGRVTFGPDYTGSRHPSTITGSLEAGMIAGGGSPSDPSEASGIAPAAQQGDRKSARGQGAGDERARERQRVQGTVMAGPWRAGLGGTRYGHGTEY